MRQAGDQQTSGRSVREVAHGAWLAERNPEHLLGWGSEAGHVRAKRRADLIIEGAELSPGACVLEIGCGTGNFTKEFTKTGVDILAVDISPELLNIARQQEFPEGQVKFVKARFEDCLVEGPFDAVIGSSVLHHLDLQPALENIFKLLKPGGKMSFAEPNMLNPQVFFERRFRHLFRRISPDETAFFRWHLYEKIRTIGFSNIRIVPFDWLHPATPACLINGVSFVGKRLENVPFLKELSGSLRVLARRPFNGKQAAPG